GAAGGAPERRVVVGAEQALEPRLLAGSGEGPPVVPGDALLALDHQADAHGPTLTVARRPGAELPQRRGRRRQRRPPAARRVSRTSVDAPSATASSPSRPSSTVTRAAA